MSAPSTPSRIPVPSGSTTPKSRTRKPSDRTPPSSVGSVGSPSSRIPQPKQRRPSSGSSASRNLKFEGRGRFESGCSDESEVSSREVVSEIQPDVRPSRKSECLIEESASRREQLALQLAQLSSDDEEPMVDVSVARQAAERSISKESTEALKRDLVSTDVISVEAFDIVQSLPKTGGLGKGAGADVEIPSCDSDDRVAASPITPLLSSSPVVIGDSISPAGCFRSISGLSNIEVRERQNSGQSMLEKEEALRGQVRELRRLVSKGDFVEGSLLLQKMSSDGTETPLQNFVDFAACLLDRQDSDYHVLLSSIGKIYTAKKDYDTALAYLKELASAQDEETVNLESILSPEDSVVNTLCSMAAVLDELGKYEEALSCYERAQIFLERCHAEACQRSTHGRGGSMSTAASEKLASVLHAVVVISCLKMHRAFSEYKLPMERLLSIPSADFHDSLASMFETKGMIVQAEYVLTSSIKAVGESLGEMHPQKVKLLVRRGDIRLEVRFFEGARKDYEEAAELASSTQHKNLEGPCRTRLAYLYFLMGNVSDAESECYSALLLSQDTNDPVTEADASRVLAQIKYHGGDTKGYGRHLQFSLLTLETMSQDKNLATKARSSYSRALEFSAEIHEDQKEYGEAATDLETALKNLAGIGRFREAMVEKKLGKLMTTTKLRDKADGDVGLAYLSSALPVFQDLVRGSEGCEAAISTYAEVLGHKMVGHTFALIGECAVLEKDVNGARCAFLEARDQLKGFRGDEVLASVEKRLRDIDSGKGCSIM